MRWLPVQLFQLIHWPTQHRLLQASGSTTCLLARHIMKLTRNVEALCLRNHGSFESKFQGGTQERGKIYS